MKKSLSLFAGAAMALSVFPAFAEPADKTGGWGEFGVQTQWIDPSIKPGDDFNAYVNGKWIAAHEIPADKTSIGGFDTLNDLSEERLHAILDELAAGGGAPAGADPRIAAAYSAFMDQPRIEAAGMVPARPWLDRIAGAKSIDDLMLLFGSPAMPSPIGLSIEPDDKQSDRYALALSQAGLGLPNRDYYLKDDAHSREIRAKYLDYLTFMLGQAGYPDPRDAAQSVLALETDMAKAMWDPEVLRDPQLGYHKLAIGQVEALGSGLPLDRFLKATGAGAASEAIVRQLPPTPGELAAARITSADAAAKMGGGLPATFKLIQTRPIAQWQAWMAAQFLSSVASYLPKAVDDAHFAFYGTVLFGQKEQRVRWKRGIGVVEGQIGEQLGRVYAERYFPEANRVAMADLVGNLRQALGAEIADITWMSPATKQAAAAKLDAFEPQIGAPKKYKAYEGLAISPSDPLANALNAGAWSTAFQMARIGKPVDRDEWYMLPETINAYYTPTFNEIVFPAAILQPPFFNISADPAVNYGAIGAVIGHEMGHGFDDQGSQYDGKGNLHDWWTEQDKAAFRKLTDRLVGEYNAFCPFDEGKTCENGKLTLGENIGDLGGLSVAYRAYKISLHGKPAPVIGGYTGDQRFFLAWAQVWREKSREAMERWQVAANEHSLSRYRVNGIVRNFNEWYKAFDVKPGDKLYLPPEQRLRIW